MKNTLSDIVVFLLLSILNSFSQTAWQSFLLKVIKNGSLTCIEDNQGFILPDFSYAVLQKQLAVQYTDKRCRQGMS